MPTDLDQLIKQSLHQRADSGVPIDPARTMGAAVGKGRRIRTRRRVVTAGAAAVVVAGIFTTGLLAPRRSDSTTPPPDDPAPTSSTSVTADLARLPAAVGQPGSTDRPDLVGTDANVVHMSLDVLAADAFYTGLQSSPGYETATVGGPDSNLTVTLSRSGKDFPGRDSMTRYGGVVMGKPAAIVVDGITGTVSTSNRLGGALRHHIFSVTWKTAGGLWANVEVETTTREQVLAMIGKIRFDQAKRCALPFQVTQLPPGVRLQTCSVRINSDRRSIFSDGMLTFTDGKRRLRVSAMDNTINAGNYPRHLRAGPYKAEAVDDLMWTMNVWPIAFTAQVETPKNPYTQRQVLDTLGSVRPAADYQNPQTW